MLKTPLYQTHLDLGAQMAPFGGWLMPIQYQGILAEHAHTRTAVSVFDICHMGEFILQGDPALSGLDRVITQKIIEMPAGSCRYGFMLNAQAGVLDDLIVYRMNKASWMLVVNAAPTLGDLENLKKNLSRWCTLENVSDQTAKLDVQGPQSLEVLKNIFGEGLAKLSYYTFGEFSFQGQRCLVSRTGYTGELGYELYLANDYVGALWKTLLADARVKPAGLGARDTLRLEMGYPLYGQDLDINHTPLAAGMEKFVDFSKDFIGREALIREQKEGLAEHLIYFQADSRRAPRHGFALIDQGRQVGRVTSGSFSPSLAVGIGMGYIRGDYEIGAPLMAQEAKIEIPVKVVKKPFYHCCAK